MPILHRVLKLFEDRTRIFCILIVILGVLLRLVLTAYGWPQTNSDEDTMGLMTLHIANHGELPIFFYGQNYMGALEAYLGVQKSMPPADVIVKMASALDLSVEYLVTGKEFHKSMDISVFLKFKDILKDLQILPDQTLEPIKAVIKAFANKEREKSKIPG